MELFLLVLQVIVAVLMIGIILLQKTTADGLSGLGGSSGLNFMSSKSQNNFLTKTTTVLAVIFMLNCLLLGNLAMRSATDNSLTKSLIEGTTNLPSQTTTTPEATPEVPLAK